MRRSVQRIDCSAAPSILLGRSTVPFCTMTTSASMPSREKPGGGAAKRWPAPAPPPGPPPAAPHVVIDDGLAAVLAPRDRDRPRFRQLAQPDFAARGRARARRDLHVDLVG